MLLMPQAQKHFLGAKNIIQTRALSVTIHEAFVASFPIDKNLIFAPHWRLDPLLKIRTSTSSNLLVNFRTFSQQVASCTDQPLEERSPIEYPLHTPLYLPQNRILLEYTIDFTHLAISN